MSLLSVASKGQGQMKAITLWGAASAFGAAAGPLIGGTLVDSTGWQGLFWIDAGIAVACVPLTLRTVQESRDPNRSRSIDWAGTVLIALALGPVVLALSKGNDWGWTSVETLGSLAISIAATLLFVRVERTATAPLVDLQLLRNRVLVGATLAILIVAGTINALMYVMSLYFQNSAGLGLSAFQTGLATLPAAAGMILVTPAITPLAAKIGAGRAVALGFALVGFVDGSWRYVAFVLPLIAVAVGMGLSNGPATSASTACVSADQVGAASGVSNMARYVGAAVATALAATIYGNVITDQTDAGQSQVDALSSGLSAASWTMAVFSLVGVVMAVVMGRRSRVARGTLADSGAAAAAHTFTLPTSATPTPPAVDGVADGVAG